jgi:hypothetical protein
VGLWVDRRWVRSAPLIVDRAAGAAVDRAVDLVHGSMVDRPKGVRLLLIRVVQWRSGCQGGPQATRGGGVAAHCCARRR